MKLPKSDFIGQHITRAKQASTHPAKLLVLSDLLRKLFQVRLEELISGVESKLGIKVLGVRGSADLIFSSVVFEVKVDLKRELDDANAKLIKYLQILQREEPDRKPVGLATDAIKFIAYSPVSDGGKVIGLKKISELNLEKSSLDDLDRLCT